MTLPLSITLMIILIVLVVFGLMTPAISCGLRYMGARLVARQQLAPLVWIQGLRASGQLPGPWTTEQYGVFQRYFLLRSLLQITTTYYKQRFCQVWQ